MSSISVTYALPGLFAVRLSRGWLFISLRSAVGNQALWLKVGTNVRKWFRLLRFSFSLMCGALHGEKKNPLCWHIRVKAVGTHFDLKTKFLTSPQPFDKGLISSQRRKKINKPVMLQHTADSLYLLLSVFRAVRFQRDVPPHCHFTLPPPPPPTKAAVTLQALWARSVFHSAATKNTGCTTVSQGSTVCH